MAKGVNMKKWLKRTIIIVVIIAFVFLFSKKGSSGNRRRPSKQNSTSVSRRSRVHNTRNSKNISAYGFKVKKK